jgi:hypothetical protein
MKMARGIRHDALALKRQRNLAATLILANLTIATVSAWIIEHYNWDVELTQTEQIFWIAGFTATLVVLLIASGFLEWLPGALSGVFVGTEAESVPNRLSAFIARHRMVFYYAGVWANMTTLALVVETTGGLPTSPFVPIFVAFVLTGQQLSRFRTQALTLFVSGLALVVVMLSCRSLVSDPATAPPDLLPIAVVILSLLMGGLLNILERPHNYLLKKQVPAPTHARIYRDGEGIWRFAFFLKRHQQDPVLQGRSDPPIPEGQFPSGLRERFEEHAREMGQHAAWTNVSPQWPSTCEQSFTIELVALEEDFP